MNNRYRLFSQRNPYNIDKTKDYFMNAVKENITLHRANCAEYDNILKSQNFEISKINTEEDLYKIPAIPTLYFKRNRLITVPEDKLIIKATSSGTKGSHSLIGFDRKSLGYGIMMMFHFFKYHRVISLLPTNYIVLAYEPSKHNNVGASKTAQGTTKFAPALHREYALKDTGKGYEINIEGIKKALMRYAKLPFPVRFVGFPSYMYFLAKALKDHNIKLKLHPKSKILLGGGWKQFSGEKVDQDTFYSLVNETLGIKKENCLEFFSAVEHPLPYCKCEHGNFHVPIYSRAIIRDVNTLKPVKTREMGLLSFVSPLMTSTPLTSVMTDDLAVLHDGSQCPCTINTPFFELKGRAGVSQIKTCTTDAAALLGGNK